jgi:putative membrane protein (TIGR04086 family)
MSNVRENKMAKEKFKRKAFIVGISIYLLSYIFIVVVLTALYNFASFTTSNIFILAPVLVTISYFFAGFAAGKVSRENGAIQGLTVGGAGAVLLITGLLFLTSTLNVRGDLSTTFPILLIMVLQSCIFCSIGGVVGQNYSRH